MAGNAFIAKKPRSFAKRLLLGAILVCALLVGAWLGSIYISSPAVRETVASAITGKLTPAKAFPGQTGVNILLMGRDLDRDNHGNVVKTHGRTDTIILAHFDFDDKTISMLSIPRDTRVRIPGYGRHKINAAHAYGGPNLACGTVERFLGVHPDDYMVVDFDGFEQAVDMVGGLNLTVDKQLDYDDNWGNLHIHLKPGPQRVNGHQAIGFVRYRMSNDGHGDSDIGRIGRQQEFLRAVKEKLMRPATIIRLPRVLGNLSPHINSSLSYTQMLTLARFAKDVPHDSIRAETLPSTLSRYCVRPDVEATRTLVREMFY